MALVVKNSTSYMSDADLTAMAAYLKDIPPNSTLRQGKPAPDPTRAAGASLYLDHCAGCHQAGGRGIPGVFPPLAGNGVVLAPRPGRHPEGGAARRAGTGQVRADARLRQPAERPAGGRPGQLRAHQLGQWRHTERLGSDGITRSRSNPLEASHSSRIGATPRRCRTTWRQTCQLSPLPCCSPSGCRRLLAGVAMLSPGPRRLCRMLPRSARPDPADQGPGMRFLPPADSAEKLEISLSSAAELCRLGLGTMIDIRQAFEIELKGAIPDTVHIPLFEVKQLLATHLRRRTGRARYRKAQSDGRPGLLHHDQPAASRA